MCHETSIRHHQDELMLEREKAAVTFKTSMKKLLTQINSYSLGPVNMSLNSFEARSHCISSVLN